MEIKSTHNTGSIRKGRATKGFTVEFIGNPAGRDRADFHMTIKTEIIRLHIGPDGSIAESVGKKLKTGVKPAKKRPQTTKK